MANNYKYIGERGVIIPDTADVKSEVQGEWRNALGQDLVVADDTPQGILIAAETSARMDVVRNNAKLANQINPNESGGVYLDAVCAWLGIEREGARATLIPGCVLRGQPQTFIPRGTRARTQNGDIAYCVSDLTIGPTGIAIGDFVCAEVGPISVPAHFMITIVDEVFGWETIDNPNPGTMGQYVQSDASLRLVRNLRLARNGISTIEAQVSGLYGVAGVRSLAFLENVSHEYQTILGIYMKPHSVWACVFGGDDADIGYSLLKNKTDGAAWNGETYVTVIEPISGVPYSVQFDRPSLVPVDIKVTLSGKGDVTQNVRDAIVSYANGGIDGERGLIVGADVSPFELGFAVNYYNPDSFVRKIECARHGGELSVENLSIALNEMAVVNPENISVVIV